MKKRKILVLFPLLGLLLTGCDFKEVMSNVKSWISENIYHPVKDFIDGKTGEDEKEKEDEGGKEEEKTVKRIVVESYPESVAEGGTIAASSVTVRVYYSDNTEEVKTAEKVTIDTSVPGDNVPMTVEYGGKSDTVTVKVIAASEVVHVEEIRYEVPTRNLHVGDTTHITITFTPDNATDQTCTFTSDNEAVLTVTQTGDVTAVSAGSAKVTVVSNDNANAKKEISFTVAEVAVGLPDSTKAGYAKLAKGETLLHGEKINIAGAISSLIYEMPAYTDPNFANIGAKKVEVEDGKLVTDEEAIFTVVSQSNDYIVLQQADGKYLTAGGSSNGLTAKEDISDASLFKYSVDENGNATLQADKVNKGILCLNPNAQNNRPLFSCYGTKQFEEYSIYHNGQGVLPESIEITSAKTLLIGAELPLTAKVNPEGSQQDVSWSIESGSDYATLSGNVLTGLAAGEVVVKATSLVKTDVIATATIEVKAPEKVLVSEIVATPASVEMTVGDDPVEISIEVSPANYEENITWAVASGSDFIELDGHKVKALAKGEGTIRIEGEESHLGVTVNVKVNPKLIPEPDKLNKTIAEIKQCEPGKTQAYASYGKIKSWASSTGEASETKSQYGNLIITDGTNDIFVYGASGNASDLAWNGETGQYKMNNSKQFLTHELTKDLKVGDYIDFYGVYYTFTKDNVTTYEMDIIVTGLHIEAPTSVEITSGSEIIVGGQLELTAKVLPEQASQAVEWTITEGADCVSKEDNVLTGVKAGNVKVKATAVGYENVYAETTIEVKAPEKKLVSEIVADPASVEMAVGDDPVEISITVTPQNYEEEIVWSVASGDTVIELEGNKVKALAHGEASIRIEGEESHNGVTIPVTVKHELKTVEEACEIATNNPSGSDEIRFRGTVIATDGNYFYVQEGEYAMFVRPTNSVGATPLEGVAVGKIVEVVAKVGLYNGLVETVNNGFVSATVVGDATSVPTATSVNSRTELGNLKQNTLASFEAKIVDKTSTSWSGSSYVRAKFNIGNDEAATTTQITLEKAAFNEENGAVWSNANVGDILIFTNVITSYYNAPQATFVEQSTMEKKVVAPETVTITSAGEVGVGSTLQLTATVGPDGASQEVDWSIIEGGNFATLADGVLTGVAAGDVKVRATAKGYENVYAETTITVSSSVVQKSYTKVTDVANLADGDTIIITDESSAHALGETENKNNIAAVSVTVDGNNLKTYEGAAAIVLEAGANGGFYLKKGDKYIAAVSSSSNYLRTTTTKDGNALWTITYTNGKMSLVANGSYTRNVMHYNAQNNFFAAYGSNSTVTDLMQIYKLA